MLAPFVPTLANSDYNFDQEALRCNSNWRGYAHGCCSCRAAVAPTEFAALTEAVAVACYCS